MFNFLVAASIGVSIADLAHCDLAEINHYQDANGRPQFVQLIAWDWSPDFQRFDAQGWLMVDSWERTPTGVVVRTTDGQETTLRCKHYRETWTKHDPERCNALLFPPQHRRKVW